MDYPSAEAAGLTIKTPTSPPFSPPPTSSPPALAPMKISIGGGTTKFTIKVTFTLVVNGNGSGFTGTAA